MKSLKKLVIAVLVIGTLSVAGLAFAHPMQGNGYCGPMGPFAGYHHMGQWNGDNMPPVPWAGSGAPCRCGQNAPMGGQMGGHHFNGQGFGHRGGPAFGQQGFRGPRGGQFQQRGKFFTDMPEEIRAKTVEVEKLRIDLDNVLSQKPLNRNKAVELEGQIGKLHQDIRAWRFGQMLDHIEASDKEAADQSVSN